MSNHIHILWELTRLNWKELPNTSFNKATAHIIVNDLQSNHPNVLEKFSVNEKERSYRIWQRDPLAILMDRKDKLEQKLDYIHLYPLNAKWNLSKYPEEYFWSSAKFYETGIDGFGFLSHYMERF
ncbi:MAG: transposase [Cytophagaceae bacterium]